MVKLKNLILTSKDKKRYEENKRENEMPNAKQKQWLKTVASWYEECGFKDARLNQYKFQIHHVVGRKAKHNKIAIGHWFVLPLPFELHDVNENHKLNVTHHRHAFTAEFGLQCELFDEMITSMKELGIDDFLDLEVVAAIMNTRK